MSTIKKLSEKYGDKLDLLDLELIISHVLKKTREFVLSHPEHKISKSQNKKIEVLIKRRVNHEPLAYILGIKEFYGLDFKVNKNVLVPRPETELLVEKALETLNRKLSNALVVDVGTGSGNIIISLANNIKNKKVMFFATDISEKALQVAKYNARKHKVEKRITFYKANLLKVKSAPQKNAKTLVITANLPYLSKEIYLATGPSVKKHEPKDALYSSEKGLRHYKKLLSQIKKLEKNSHIFLEISPEQKKELTKIVNSNFSEAKMKFHKDLADKWRVCEIEV